MSVGTKKFFVGVDLGGTNISSGILDSDNGLLIRRKRRTRPELGSEAVVGRIVALVERILDELQIERSDVGGLGIGGPGAADVKRGVILDAPNLGWRNYELAKRLERALELPVAVDNDVNVAVYGEVVAGAARRFQDVFGIWTGTGVGGGLVLGGKLFHGPRYTAGEIGHFILLPGAPLGQRTLEHCASRSTMVRLAVRLIKENHPSLITELVDGDYSQVRSKVLAKAVAAGDSLVNQVVREAANLTAIAAANVVTLLSIPCVVLGGGLPAELGDTWVHWVRKSFRKHVYPDQLRDTTIVGSALQDDAGVVGAALIARERLT